MAYNETVIGKIRSIDYNKGVGEIVSSNNTFMFTIDDLSTNDKYNEGDLVKFRAELVQDTPKAYFINKITPEEIKDNYNILRSKTYHM